MDDIKTIWCGNLSDQVTEELLYELFLQAAPLEKVKIPTDREGRKSNFAFITFKHEQSVNYVLQLLSGTRLFEKTLNIKPRTGNAQNRSVERNTEKFDFQNDRINQMRQQSPRGRVPRYDHSPNTFSDNRRYDHSPNMFSDNRQSYSGGNSFRDREDRHRDWDNRKSHNQHDGRNNSDSPNRRHNYNEGPRKKQRYY